MLDRRYPFQEDGPPAQYLEGDQRSGERKPVVAVILCVMLLLSLIVYTAPSVATANKSQVYFDKR